jgi:hypothetical protein
MWLFDEADARYQVDDGTVSSSSKFMIGAEDCNEKDALVLPVVAHDILEIKVSLVAVALNTEDAITRLKVATVALLSAFIISFVFIFIDG